MATHECALLVAQTRRSHGPLPALGSKALAGGTWPDFVKLFERHGGVWGGCWCMFYHIARGWSKRTAQANKADKERLVRQGKAHGILLYDRGEPIAWCQFGPREELPRVDRMKNYTSPKRDAWRITCFFVDRRYRRRGILPDVLDAALRAMQRLGAKRVEAYPVDIGEKRYHASDLWWGTLKTFEERGFARVRRLGKNQWIVRRQFQPTLAMSDRCRSRG